MSNVRLNTTGGCMYIPKLRNPEQIVEYFKQYDSDTAVTVLLLKTLASGNKIMCMII